MPQCVAHWPRSPSTAGNGSGTCRSVRHRAPPPRSTCRWVTARAGSPRRTCSSRSARRRWPTAAVTLGTNAAAIGRSFGESQVRVGDPILGSQEFDSRTFFGEFRYDSVDDVNFPRQGGTFSLAWQGSRMTVHRAMRLIRKGALDREGIEELAARLGIGARHLDRLFRRHIGASPLQVARTMRVQRAKRLLDRTELPMAEVAAQPAPVQHGVRRSLQTPTERDQAPALQTDLGPKEKGPACAAPAL